MRRGAIAVLALLVAGGAAWVLVRPGVFTIQPIGAVPEGVTFVYHSRGEAMPFFSSPDGMCLRAEGGVSLMCRLASMAAMTDAGLMDRVIMRLDYSEWAYLQSTDGATFDR